MKVTTRRLAGRVSELLGRPVRVIWSPTPWVAHGYALNDEAGDVIALSPVLVDDVTRGEPGALERLGHVVRHEVGHVALNHAARASRPAGSLPTDEDWRAPAPAGVDTLERQADVFAETFASALDDASIWKLIAE